MTVTMTDLQIRACLEVFYSKPRDYDLATWLREVAKATEQGEDFVERAIKIALDDLGL